LAGGQVVSAQLQSQQEAAEMASKAGTDVAADAYKRALEAIEKRGAMATELRGQEFGEKAKKAEAQDIINRFNVGQMSEAQRRNIDRENQARLFNLQREQQVSDLNTQLKQEEQRRLAQAKQDRYTDLYNIAQGKANVRVGAAQSAAQQAAAVPRGQSAGSVIAQGVGQMGMGLASYGLGQMQSQPGTQYDYMGSEYKDDSGKWVKYD
jgi:hypothetical protein